MKTKFLYVLFSFLAIFSISSSAFAAISDAERQAFINQINQHRATVGLPALQRWVDGEACADNSSKTDAESNTPHGSIADCKVRAQNTCPDYPSVEAARTQCLQQMWNEGPPAYKPCTGACYQQHGHYINMTNPDYTKVAVGIYQRANGKVWVNMNFQ